MPTEHEDWISSYEAHEPKSSPRLAVVEAAEWVATIIRNQPEKTAQD